MKKIWLLFAVLTAQSCVHIDKTSVQARPGAPESANVSQREMPFDVSRPRYILVLDEVRFQSLGPVHVNVVSTINQEQGEKSTSGNSRSDRGVTSQSNTEGNGTITKLERNSKLEEEVPQSQRQDTSRADRTVSDLQSVAYDSDGHPQTQNMSGTMISGQGTANQHSALTDTTLSKHGTSQKEDRRNVSVTTNTSWTVNEEREKNQRQIVSMFRSALLGMKNFSLVEPGAVRLPTFSLTANERGPFLIRAMITEYESRVEEEKSKFNLLTIYGSKEKVRVGVVGLDVSIVEMKTGEILSSFPVQAQFRSAENKAKQGFIFPLAEQERFAQSVLDQALRAALGDAALKAWDVLSNSVS